MKWLWPIRRGKRIVLAALLVIHAGLLAYSAALHSPVIDEPAHLAAGLSHWEFGDFSLYRVNPPLVRLVATAPLLVTEIKTDWSNYGRDPERRFEFQVGDDLAAANGAAIFRYTTIARWACIPFSLVGLLIAYRWSRLLFGRNAGLAAALLWCFSPTILGHGSLITPDAAATAMGMAACYTFARWLASPHWSRAVLAGLFLGAAEACKSTWIILFVLFPVIWLVFRYSIARTPSIPNGRQLTIILLLGWAILMSLYGWQGFGAELGTLPIRSQAFRRLLGEPTTNGDFHMRPEMAWLRLPFPREYILGLDQQHRDLEGPHRSYLRGEWRTEGWWYYYLYGLGVKEPAGALLLAALSLIWLTVQTVHKRTRHAHRRQRFAMASALVAIALFVILVVASVNTGMNHHVRYVMPVVPLLYLLGSGLLDSRGSWTFGRSLVGASLVAWSIVSSLAVFPHSLSYFNEFAGGPKNGVQHLNNSNIDWGQDLLLLRDWVQANKPEGRFHLAYFGRVNPRAAGIDYQLPSLASSKDVQAAGIAMPHLEPGWYAVSVTLLQGRAYMIRHPNGQWVTAEENSLAYFRLLQPTSRAGYSIDIYRVPES